MRTEEQAGADAQSKTEKINEHRRIGKQRNNRNQKKTEKQKEETKMQEKVWNKKKNGMVVLVLSV